jgi:hypothetical protein
MAATDGSQWQGRSGVARRWPLARRLVEAGVFIGGLDVPYAWSYPYYGYPYGYFYGYPCRTMYAPRGRSAAHRPFPTALGAA